ncbi:MAG: TMEM165/GDT1 family protein [Polyangiaceae bacterium]
MDLRVFATVFGTVFLAELGDKTQLATLLFAADGKVGKWTVFFASALALVATSAIGVLVGATLSTHVNPKLLNWVAGIGFVGIGIWTLVRA